MNEFTRAPLPPLPDDAHLLRPLLDLAEEDPAFPIAAVRVDDQFVDVSAKEFVDRVHASAKGLIAAGVCRGDRVALMAHTRLEWIIVDYAILLAGGVTVPITTPRQSSRWSGSSTTAGRF